MTKPKKKSHAKPAKTFVGFAMDAGLVEVVKAEAKANDRSFSAELRRALQVRYQPAEAK